MSTNSLLIILTAVVSIAFIGISYLRAKHERPDKAFQRSLTMDDLLDLVKFQLVELIKEENYYNKPDSDLKAIWKRKTRIQNAMEDAPYGIDTAKEIIKDLIRGIVIENVKDEEDALKLIDFDAMYLDTHIKFEAIMIRLKKSHGKDAFTKMVEKYDLDRERFTENGDPDNYYIEPYEIDMIYGKECELRDYKLMIDVITVLLFEKYKGFGVIDTLREMNINGLTCGTSGSVLYTLLNKTTQEKLIKATQSIWVQYKGKYIHCRFLEFESQDEVRRIAQSIGRWNRPGPITEKRGYLVNTMYDQSRVLIVRPPAGEYWAFFIRKFSLESFEMDFLLNPQKKDIVKDEETGDITEVFKPLYKNTELPSHFIQYLMRGRITTGFTGRMSSGKTTFMKSTIPYMDPKLNIRVLEMAPEMYLRELYPTKNIYSVQETEFISAAMLQDALKKSDGGITIIGEVATDAVAARMIQLGQVASEFTIFTHHAVSADSLVYSLRNSLAATGDFTQEVAEQQVISVVTMNVHHAFSTNGERYIKRISEIIPLDEYRAYPAYDPRSPIDSMNRITAEYYVRRTDRKSFETKDLIVFNEKDKVYEIKEKPSSELIARILSNLDRNESLLFKKFIVDNWHIA